MILNSGPSTGLEVESVGLSKLDQVEYKGIGLFTLLSC